MAAELPEPNAVVVATADADGAPDARIVLMKGYDASGFVFGTSYASAKGAQLAVNPRAALVFPWHALQRQVRVTGRVERIGDTASDGLWDPRPRGSQLAAVASVQSTVVDSREELADRVRLLDEQTPGGHGAAAGGLGRLPGACPSGGVLAGRRRTGCTTGCGSCATTRRAAAGSCSGWPRDDGPPLPRQHRSTPVEARRPGRGAGPGAGGAAGRSTPRRCATRTTGGCSAGVAATMLGQQMTLVAVPFQVYALTGSSLLVGVTSIVALVPLIVFGLLGGAIADAMDRRRLMLITSVGAAVTSALLAVQALLPGGGNLARAVGADRVRLRLRRGQPADPQRGHPGAGRARPASPAANALAMTVRQAGVIVGPLLAGRADRRWATCSSPTPSTRSGFLVAALLLRGLPPLPPGRRGRAAAAAARRCAGWGRASRSCAPSRCC